MASSVSGTGSVTSQGIGSGLDVTGIISKLMELEKKPLTTLQDKATQIQSTISTFGAVQSAVSALRDAARTLTNSQTWAAATGNSADASSVGVTTAPGAAIGNYGVQVQNL